MIEERWRGELERCVEGLYVIEDETKRIVWANSFFSDGGSVLAGEACWRALFGRGEPCPSCPALAESDGVYSWELFDSRRDRWMKIKHCVFKRDGKLYRAGNVIVIDEEMQLNRETVEEISNLRTDLTENQGELVSLRRAALHDKLTGLYDRNRYLKELERGPDAPANFGVLYLDLNNLKETNDRCGHNAGDALLCALSRAMYRAGEAAGGAECYRMGGDEFLMTLRDCTAEKLADCARRIALFFAEETASDTCTGSVAVGQKFSPEPRPLEKAGTAGGSGYVRVKQFQKTAPPRDRPQNA
jgi:diguanylate cyclase (GGDEF)-like protein